MTTIASRPLAPPLLERGLDSSSGLGVVRERRALLGKTLFLVADGAIDGFEHPTCFDTQGQGDHVAIGNARQASVSRSCTLRPGPAGGGRAAAPPGAHRQDQGAGPRDIQDLGNSAGAGLGARPAAPLRRGRALLLKAYRDLRGKTDFWSTREAKKTRDRMEQVSRAEGRPGRLWALARR